MLIRTSLIDLKIVSSSEFDSFLCLTDLIFSFIHFVMFHILPRYMRMTIFVLFDLFGSFLF